MPLFPIFARYLFQPNLYCGVSRSRTTMVCTCLVVASFKFMPSISAFSCIAWLTKTLTLSVILSLGK